MYEFYDIYGIRDRAAAVINFHSATIACLMSQNLHKKQILLRISPQSLRRQRTVPVSLLQKLHDPVLELVIEGSLVHHDMGASFNHMPLRAFRQ